MDKKVKQIKFRISKQIGEPSDRKNYKTIDEIAASKENSNKPTDRNPYSFTNEKDPPEIKILKKVNPKRRKSVFHQYPKLKHFIISGVAAIFVGVVLGFIMLKIAAGMNTDDDAEPSTPSEQTETNSGDTENGSVPAAGTETTSVSFDPISAQVVQIGAFQTEAAAVEFSASYEAVGIKPIIWYRDELHYTFVGIANTENQIDVVEQSVNDLVEGEPYSKEWVVAGKTKETSEIEGNWVKEGMNIWQEAISQFSTSQTLDDNTKENIANWLQTKPETMTDEAISFVQRWETLSETIQGEGQVFHIHHQLLQIFYEYETYINS